MITLPSDLVKHALINKRLLYSENSTTTQVTKFIGTTWDQNIPVGHKIKKTCY